MVLHLHVIGAAVRMEKLHYFVSFLLLAQFYFDLWYQTEKNWTKINVAYGLSFEFHCLCSILKQLVAHKLYNNPLNFSGLCVRFSCLFVMIPLCGYQFDQLPSPPPPGAPQGFCTKVCAQPQDFCTAENAWGLGQ